MARRECCNRVKAYESLKVKGEADDVPDLPIGDQHTLPPRQIRVFGVINAVVPISGGYQAHSLPEAVNRRIAPSVREQPKERATLRVLDEISRLAVAPVFNRTSTNLTNVADPALLAPA
jgi:hypothetical protein